MKHWSIGTDYDRPIPRRIAEDAGVPRQSFGQEKRATTALLHLHGDAAWTSPTRDAVLEYARRIELPLRTRLGYVVDAIEESSRSFAYRVPRKLKLLRLAPAPRGETYGRPQPHASRALADDLGDRMH